MCRWPTFTSQPSMHKGASGFASQRAIWDGHLIVR
jgi:hypothetical protein